MLRGRTRYFELVKVLGFTDFKLRFSTSILGYLCTGILIGPSVLHMVSEEEVES